MTSEETLFSPFVALSIKWFLLLQKTTLEPSRILRNHHELSFETPLGLTGDGLKTTPEKKLLKVAIVGRPNAGKSTLINAILKLNLCGVSHKSHTTKTTFRVAFTQGHTQLVFVDTPGFVTQKECSRFNLSESFLNWRKTVLDEVDIIGVIHEVTEPGDIWRMHLNLKQNIDSFPDSKPKFLVFNKIDLVLDKDALSAAIDGIMKPKNLERRDSRKEQKIWQHFSRIFFTAAVKDKGVSEVADYLLEQAKPGQWLFEPGQTFNGSLHVLIKDLLRSQLLDILPHEIPYQCSYEVEYLRENELGELVCVCLITCRYNRHAHLILSGKKGNLGTICKQLESDLYKILRKVIKMRLVVKSRQKN